MQTTVTATAPVVAKAPGFVVRVVGNTPAAYFGIVLGLAGLGNAWRAATAAWQFPAAIGEGIFLAAGFIWAMLVILYALKAVLAPAKLAAEAAHPIQCCFIGLAGVATMLIAGGLVPHERTAALVVFAVGFTFTALFGIWRTGGLWHGERDPGTTTAVLYLPTVGGSFVAAGVISALGHPDWGQLAFGAGFFSWLAMESVLMHRFLTGPATPAVLRPTLGIQLAPAPVGAVAYLAVSGGAPDMFAHALVGYGIFQLLVLARLSPWSAEAGFVPGFWAYSFGASAIAAAPVRLLSHGDHGAMAVLAPVLFVVGNIMIGALSLMTLVLLFSGKMFAAPPAAPSSPSR